MCASFLVGRRYRKPNGKDYTLFYSAFTVGLHALHVLLDLLSKDRDIQARLVCLDVRRLLVGMGSHASASPPRMGCCHSSR